MSVGLPLRTCWRLILSEQRGAARATTWRSPADRARTARRRDQPPGACDRRTRAISPLGSSRPPLRASPPPGRTTTVHARAAPRAVPAGVAPGGLPDPHRHQPARRGGDCGATARPPAAVACRSVRVAARKGMGRGRTATPTQHLCGRVTIGREPATPPHSKRSRCRANTVTASGDRPNDTRLEPFGGSPMAWSWGSSGPDTAAPLASVEPGPAQPGAAPVPLPRPPADARHLPGPLGPPISQSPERGPQIGNTPAG